MIGTVVRTVLLVALYALFPAKVYFLGIANISVNLVEGFSNLAIQRKIMPELRVERKKFRICFWRDLRMVSDVCDFPRS